MWYYLSYFAIIKIGNVGDFMNILEYIDTYGNYSFSEKEFNEVDNLVFSSLIYVDLKRYVSRSFFRKKTIEEVGKAFFENYNKKSKNISSIRVGIKVLNRILTTKRYKDLLLYNYSYVGNSKQQFCAVTIEISKDLLYVSFEGTDQLISGWKEDFMLCYKFPVISQKLAMEYINRLFVFTRKKIILGGHSKGGNLAMTAGMYANIFVRNKIIKIYNNDGPGFRKEQLDRYNRISNKLVNIIPNYSVVGLLLNHSDNYIVVKSSKKGIGAHNLVYWMIDNNRFEKTELSNNSVLLEKSVCNWLDKYSDLEKEKFVYELFLVFDKANINSLVEILNNKKLIFGVIKQSGKMDKKIKNMIMDFIYLFFSLFKDSKSNEIGNFIQGKFGKLGVKKTDNNA